jgi:hypothetical protein
MTYRIITQRWFSYSLFHMTLHSFIGPVTLIGVVVFRQDAPYG